MRKKEDYCNEVENLTRKIIMTYRQTDLNRGGH